MQIIINEAVPLYGSLNRFKPLILGEDAVPGTPEFDLFIEIQARSEMTVKCGQKCTAIHRHYDLIPETDECSKVG